MRSKGRVGSRLLFICNENCISISPRKCYSQGNNLIFFPKIDHLTLRNSSEGLYDIATGNCITVTEF